MFALRIVNHLLRALGFHRVFKRRETIVQTPELMLMEQMGGKAFVRQLIDLLIGESKARVEKIDLCLSVNNFGEAGELFHQIQGSAAATGAQRLRRLAAQGQQSCTRQDLTRASRCRELVRRELLWLAKKDNGAAS